MSDPESFSERTGEKEQIAVPADVSDADYDYPEGGWRAWSVVFGSFCGMLACYGYMNTISTYNTYLSKHQLSDYSESSIGWIWSVYIFLTFFCGIQIGPVFDAQGPRILILSGTIALMASIMILGVCTRYYQFLLVFGILGGTGTSLVVTPATAAIGHFFLARRGGATGLATIGGSLGGVIFPLLLEALLMKAGWGWATRSQGFIFLVLLVLTNLLVRSRLPPRHTVGRVLPDLKIFLQPSFVAVTVAAFFLEWGLFVPVTYLTSYSVSTHAMSSTFSYQVIAIYNASSSIGRWASGILADRFGNYNVMIVTVALCVFSSAALWLPAAVISAFGSYKAIDFGLTVAYSVLMGIASGSNISLAPVCVGALCDTSRYGEYYGLCYMVVALGTLVGVPITGAIIQANGGIYWGAALFCAACYLCALICFVAVRVAKVGWQLNAKY